MNHSISEGEYRRDAALALLEARRESVVRRAQRALLTVALQAGSVTADAVRELVELPPGVGPKCFGAAPRPLVRAGILRAAGFTRTARPLAHARPITVWEIADREAALKWLRENPDVDVPDSGDSDDGDRGGSQKTLFSTCPMYE